MNQWREDMKKRTHAFAVDVVRFVREIPDRSDTRRLKDQLVGAASSADFNWHAACRGRTHKEFTSKLGLVLEKADEAAECLEVIRDSRIATGDELARLCQEGLELRLIFSKAARTANANEERAKKMRKAGRPSCLPTLPSAFQPYCPPALLSIFMGSALIGSSFSRWSSWLTGGIFAFTPVSSLPSSSSRPFDKVRNTE